MKNWIKRQKHGLQLLGLLAACCLLWGVFGTVTKATEALAPQLEFTKTLDKAETTNGTSVLLSYETYSLKPEDFTEDKVMTSLLDSMDYADAGKYITGGKVTAVLDGKIPENGNLDLCLEYDGYDQIVLSSSSGTCRWEGDDRQGHDSNYLTDPYTFYIYYHSLGATAEENEKQMSLWAVLTYQGKDYLIRFPVELQPNGAYLADLNNHNEPWIDFYTAKKNSGNNRYELDPAQVTGEKRKLSGTVYTVEVEKYNKSWEYVDCINPIYALGASGNETFNAYLSGREMNVYKSDIPFVKRDTPFTFDIVNDKGVSQSYTVSIKMPWQITTTVNFNNCMVYLETKDGGEVTAPNGEIGIFPEEYMAGETVTLRLDLQGAEQGKRISGVTLRDESAGGGKEVPYTLQGNRVTFTMPTENVVISSVLTEEVREEHGISTSVVEKDTEDTKISGTVTVQNAEGTAVSTAAKDTELTVTAGKLADFKSFYDWEFDYWEATGIVLSEEQKKAAVITITMPDNAVTLKAVYARSGEEITLGTTEQNGGRIALGLTNVGIIYTEQQEFTNLYKTEVTYDLRMDNLNLEGYNFLGWKDENGDFYDTGKNENGITWETVGGMGGDLIYPNFKLQAGQPRTFIAVFEAKMAGILILESGNDAWGTVSAVKGGAPVTEGDVLYDGDIISLKAEPKTGYIFKEWKVTEPAADSGVTFADANAAETTFVMPRQQKLAIEAVFAEDPAYKSDACQLTRVELLTKDGTVVKQANKSGTAFTLQISPSEMTPEEAGKLTSGSYLLRLTYSDKAVAEQEGGFKDGDNGSDTWREGITNTLSKGQTKTFIITAENGTDKNTYTISITYDDRPILTAGNVKRLSDTEASVSFTSSSTGMYYYAVAEQGAAKPAIPTDGVGIRIPSANHAVTINVNSLTAGAKDIYIVVKNDDKANDIKISDTLKMSIPAYDEEEVTYQVSLYKTEGGTIALTASKGTISTADAASGKPAVIDVKAGDTVKLTVTPNSGKRMVSGSLKRSQGGAPYEVKDIDEKTMQFVMPAYDLSVSCRFEDASAEEPDTSKKLNGFIVNGVNGVINDTSGTVTITLPNGTDLTKLSPTVIANGAKSISPASGAVVNLSKPITYTITFEDGTTKKYTVTAYTEAPSVSDRLWEDMLDNAGGNTDHTGSRTWWEKAKKYKKNNDYPQYWAPLD